MGMENERLYSKKTNVVQAVKETSVVVIMKEKAGAEVVQQEL